jgi:hypothetical protein
MANTIRLKRRASGGAAGAPSSLLSAEPAFNEQDDVLYYGKGDSGGDATSIIPIGGPGAFVTLSTTQTISGTKTFSTFLVTPSSAPTTNYQVANKKYVDDSVSSAGGGDMLASVYDPTAVEGDAFDMDNMVEGTSTKILTATERTKLGNIETAADVTDAGNVGSAIAGASAKTTPVSADRFAMLDSAASNALKYMTYANLLAAISAAVETAITDGAPGALDTLNELAAALGDDADFAGTVTTALAAKAPLASPTFTGNPTAPTPSAADDDTSIATTEFVNTAIASAVIDGGTF